MDGDNAAEIARQRAEARRQKILARQKDRLTAITGVYAQPAAAEAAPPEEPAAAPAAVASAAAEEALSPSGRPAPAAPLRESTPSGGGGGGGEQQQQLEAMLASLQASLQSAAAATALDGGGGGGGPPLVGDFGGLGGGGGGGGRLLGPGARGALSQADADAANAAMQTLLAGAGVDGLIRSLGGAGAGAGANNGGSSGAGPDSSDGGGLFGSGPAAGPSTSGLQPQAQARRDEGALAALRRGGPAALLWLGRAAGVAVQWTQLARLLSAALIAYAASAGLLSPQRSGDSTGSGGWAAAAAAAAASPAAALVLTQLAIVLGALVVFGRAVSRRVSAGDGQYGIGGPGGGEPRLPARLRQFDVLSYMPGAREALAGLAGYRQLASGLAEGAAVYLLVCGLLALPLPPRPGAG